jgi:hypothetical protein
VADAVEDARFCRGAQDVCDEDDRDERGYARAGDPQARTETFSKNDDACGIDRTR